MCTPSWMTTLALYARRGLSTMYIRNRAPTKAPDGRTSCEVLYDMKPDLANLCTSGVLCAIVGSSENLNRVNCGSSYEHQQGTVDICATYVHRWVIL